MDGKSQVTVYSAWNKRMEQRGKPVVVRSQLGMDMFFLRDRDEWDHVKALEAFIRDRTDGQSRPEGVLSECLLSAPYDTVPFLTWSTIWRGAAKYEAKNCVRGGEAYFLGCHDREFYMNPREERVKLYAKVPSWWQKDEQCRALLVPTGPLFSYVSHLIINDSPLTGAFCCVDRANHCVMVIMVFLQWVHPIYAFIKMRPTDHEPRMLKNVYKGVLYPLPDAVLRFLLEAGVYNIVPKTRYSPVLAHAANLRALEVD